MTIGEWLSARTPEAPPALARHVIASLGEDLARPFDEATEVLLHSSERLARSLLHGDATCRESALDLLAADALVTYAFEAAAERPDLIDGVASRASLRLALAGCRARAGTPASREP